MNKHTPGPWIALGDGPEEGYEYTKEDLRKQYVISEKTYNFADPNKLDYWDDYGRELCVAVDGWADGASLEEREANIYLIAAAPCLLDALQYCIKMHPELAKVKGIADAIAKATGGQP